MFIKISFGKVDFKKISENDTGVSFWGSDKFFKKLPEPINWEHGVFQYYNNDIDERFWWSFKGADFLEDQYENFIDTISKPLESIEDKDLLFHVFENICISGASLFDIEDSYEENSYGIEDSESLDISEFSNYDPENNNLWVFEVSRYENPPIEIVDNKLNLNCENNEDDLTLERRFIFCIDYKE